MVFTTEMRASHQRWTARAGFRGMERTGQPFSSCSPSLSRQLFCSDCTPIVNHAHFIQLQMRALLMTIRGTFLLSKSVGREAQLLVFSYSSRQRARRGGDALRSTEPVPEPKKERKKRKKRWSENRRQFYLFIFM